MAQRGILGITLFSMLVMLGLFEAVSVFVPVQAPAPMVADAAVEAVEAVEEMAPAALENTLSVRTAPFEVPDSSLRLIAFPQHEVTPTAALDHP